MKKQNKYGLPNGLQPMANGRYSARYNGKHIGNFDTLEEAAIATMTSLIAKELRNVDSFEFENPNDMVRAMKELATARLKLSEYRTKAVKALEKAKNQLKTELQKEIQSDPELLERLCKIIDSTEVK